jgi:hypothetical protein
MCARSTISRAALVVALASASAADSAAQPAAPYRPIFGAASGSTTNGTVLDVRLDVAEAYDSNVLGDRGGVPVSPLTVSGLYTSASPEFDFAHRSKRLQVVFAGGSTFRRYPSLGTVEATTHHAVAGFNAEVTSRTTLSVTETVTYAPAYLYRLFTSATPLAPDVLAPATSNYSVDDQRSYAYATAMGATHSLTRRASFSLMGETRRTNYVLHLPGYVDLRSYGVGGSFAYSLNRATKARISYTYHDATYSPTLHPLEHDLEVGVEYHRPLSPTRAAILTANVGPRLLTAQTSSSGLLPTNSGYAYRLTGDGSVDYQVARTWHVAANYRRGLMFLETLPGPVFTDGIAASTRGFLNRRLEAIVSSGYSRGQLEFAKSVGSLTTYTGDVRFQVGLSRIAAIYAEYLLYYYDLSQEINLASGLPHHLNRNGVRVGLNLWAPVGTGQRVTR